MFSDAAAEKSEIWFPHLYLHLISNAWLILGTLGVSYCCDVTNNGLFEEKQDEEIGGGGQQCRMLEAPCPAQKPSVSR